MWDPFKSYSDKARHIIERNNYIALATADRRGNPWVAAVFFVYDDDYNFYFLSSVDSRHGKNIASNDSIAGVIFDSTSPLGSSDSVQVCGRASLVEKKDIKHVIETYVKRLFPTSKISSIKMYRPEDYLEPAEFRFFKVTPKDVYTAGENGKVEVNLKG